MNETTRLELFRIALDLARAEHGSVVASNPLQPRDSLEDVFVRVYRFMESELLPTHKHGRPTDKSE